MVVEDDVAGMVGIVTNFLLVGTRPMDDPQRVYECSSTLGFYSGIATGLYRLAGSRTHALCSTRTLLVAPLTRTLVALRNALLTPPLAALHH